MNVHLKEFKLLRILLKFSGWRLYSVYTVYTVWSSFRVDHPKHPAAFLKLQAEALSI